MGIEYDLRKVQLTELEVLLEFDRICEKYKLPYLLIGGSAIGAVRHGGFIPWDEDVDVGMLRKDYERFLEVCEQELSNKYFLQTYCTDRAYCGQFAKIRVNGTTFLEVEPSAANPEMHHGIFIDIFPLDHVPDNNVLARLQYTLVRFLNSIIHTNGATVHKKTLKNLIKLAYSYPFKLLFSKAKLSRLCTRIASWYNDTRRVTNFFGRYGFAKETAPREWFGKPVLMEFEGHLLPLPEGWHDYLSQIYGDYMKLPPEEERGTHEIFLVDFEHSFSELGGANL